MLWAKAWIYVACFGGNNNTVSIYKRCLYFSSKLFFVLKVQIDCRGACEITKCVGGMTEVYDFKIAITLCIGLFQDDGTDIVENGLAVELLEEVIDHHLDTLSTLKQIHGKSFTLSIVLFMFGYTSS